MGTSVKSGPILPNHRYNQLETMMQSESALGLRATTSTMMMPRQTALDNNIKSLRLHFEVCQLASHSARIKLSSECLASKSIEQRLTGSVQLEYGTNTSHSYCSTSVHIAQENCCSAFSTNLSPGTTKEAQRLRESYHQTDSFDLSSRLSNALMETTFDCLGASEGQFCLTLREPRGLKFPMIGKNMKDFSVDSSRLRKSDQPGNERFVPSNGIGNSEISYDYIKMHHIIDSTSVPASPVSYVPQDCPDCCSFGCCSSSGFSSSSNSDCCSSHHDLYCFSSSSPKKCRARCWMVVMEEIGDSRQHQQIRNGHQLIQARPNKCNKYQASNCNNYVVSSRPISAMENKNNSSRKRPLSFTTSINLARHKNKLGRETPEATSNKPISSSSDGLQTSDNNKTKNIYAATSENNGIAIKNGLDRKTAQNFIKVPRMRRTRRKVIGKTYNHISDLIVVHYAMFLLSLLLMTIFDHEPFNQLSFSSNWVSNQVSSRRVFSSADAKTISIKIGALFEETDFEQSNVFVRTIKMINEGQSDAMRQLLTPTTSYNPTQAVATQDKIAAPAVSSPPTIRTTFDSSTATTGIANGAGSGSMRPSTNSPNSPSNVGAALDVQLAPPDHSAASLVEQDKLAPELGAHASLFSGSSYVNRLQENFVGPQLEYHDDHKQKQKQLKLEKVSGNEGWIGANEESSREEMSGGSGGQPKEVEKLPQIGHLGDLEQAGKYEHDQWYKDRVPFSHSNTYTYPDSDSDSDSSTANTNIEGTKRSRNGVGAKKKAAHKADIGELATIDLSRNLPTSVRTPFGDNDGPTIERPVGAAGQSRLTRSSGSGSDDHTSHVVLAVLDASTAATIIDTGYVNRKQRHENSATQNGQHNSLIAPVEQGPTIIGKAPLGGTGYSEELHVGEKWLHHEERKMKFPEVIGESYPGCKSRCIVNSSQHTSEKYNRKLKLSWPIESNDSGAASETNAASNLSTNFAQNKHSGRSQELSEFDVIRGQQRKKTAAPGDEAASASRHRYRALPAVISPLAFSETTTDNLTTDGTQASDKQTMVGKLEKGIVHVDSRVQADEGVYQARDSNIHQNSKSTRTQLELNKDNKIDYDQYIETTRRRETRSLGDAFSIWNPFRPSHSETSSSSMVVSSVANDESATQNGQQQPMTRVKFEPMVEFLTNRDSSFEADKRVCQLIQSGVRTLIGPLEGLSIQHVQSICDNMELPYFQLRPFLGSMSSTGAATTVGLPQVQETTTNWLQNNYIIINNKTVTEGNKQNDAWLANLHRSDKLQLDRRPVNNSIVSRRDATGPRVPNWQAHEAINDSVESKGPPQLEQGDTLSRSVGYPSELTSHQVASSLKIRSNKYKYQQPDLSIVIPSNFNKLLNKNNSHTQGANGGLYLSAKNDNDAANNINNPANNINYNIPPAEAPSMAANYGPSLSSGDDLLTLNLHPPAHLLTSAYIDLIYAWNWTSFAIVYEHESSMIKLQDLFRESSGTWTSRWKIKLFRYRQQHRQHQSSDKLEQSDDIDLLKQQQHDHLILDSSYLMKSINHQNNVEESNARHNYNDNNYHASGSSNNANMNTYRQTDSSINSAEQQSETFRDLFWRIKRSGEQNIILDLGGNNLNEALKQAQQVGCMTDRFNYLITSLDLHVADLENFKYGRTRITALSLINLDPYLQSNTQQQQQELSRNHLADEQYLEQLGLQIIPRSNMLQYQYIKRKLNYATTNGNSQQQNQPSFRSRKFPKFKLSPSIVLDKTGSFMDPPTEAFAGTSGESAIAQSSDAPRSNHADVGGQGFGGGSGSGSVHHISGYQVPRSQAEDELFHLLISRQYEMHNLSRVRLSTSSAILHDSLILMALGLRELDPNGSYINTLAPAPTGSAAATSESENKTIHPELIQLSCTNPDSGPWRYGSSLINYMHRLSFTGLTGRVRFDRRGLRSSFKLNILGIANEIGLVKVGEWHSELHNQTWPGSSSDHGAKTMRLPREDEELPEVGQELARVRKLLEQDDSAIDSSGQQQPKRVFTVPYGKSLPRSSALRVNKVIFERLYKEQTDQIDTLIVTTKLSQPYFMLKETPNKLEGNDQYEGFAVDLIHELSRLLNFRYRWREVADKKYGARETLENGTVVWNGMIGEIVRGDADLAIVDLTITSQREEAVDFTLPFMNTGISILFKKPTTKVTTLYSFLSPFTRDVWAYVLAAYCGISAILFFVGHLSPYEWADPHPCPHLRSEDSLMEAMLHNQFSLPNSFWFTIGSLMQQGSDLTPRSMSTRTIAGIWYFFTLIMISSYTANLAAFLTVEKVIYPIENVRDLANQQEIRYGCVESGSTCTFFKDSQIDTYKRINETMHKFKSYLKSNEEGQKRVEEGKFAFFMESASIEYIVERNCNLTQIGGLLDSKGYGLATSKKSRLKRPYRTLLSEGILHLQETGMLHVLKNRWWKERRGGGTCADDGKGGGVTELSLANVGGVFVVLVGGLCLAFSVAMGEFLWRSKRNGMSRNNLCDHMMNDLKFALNCTKSVKTVSQQERLAKRQRSLTRMSSSQRSQSQSESQSQLNTLSAPIMSQPASSSSGAKRAPSNQHDQTGNNQHNYLMHSNSDFWSSNQHPQQFESIAAKQTDSRKQRPSQKQQSLTRRPVVGFSTSDEIEYVSPENDTAHLAPRSKNRQSQNSKQQQQLQQQPDRMQAAALLASMLLQQQQLHQATILNQAGTQMRQAQASLQLQKQHQDQQSQKHMPALADLHASSLQQPSGYLAGSRPSERHLSSRDQRPKSAVGASLARDFATSQRRQLFAQQTVDTIDDELAWQQN